MSTERWQASDSLERLTLPPSASLRRALQVVDEAGIEIALVVDPDSRRVLGTLSDGDLRRAILRGIALDTADGVREAMQPRFRWVAPHVGRAEVLDLMRGLAITQVPVLDPEGRLVGMHLLHDMLGRVERGNVAVIMCGGQGARLRPLTENVPKPMLPVAGRPILERLVLHVVSHGIRDVYLAVNYLASMIEEHFGDGERFGCRIHYLREEKPLGTGGPLSLLPPITEPVLVMNGDLVTQADLGLVLDRHVERASVATICLRPHRMDVPFGVADVDGDRLIGLREKPSEHYLVNAGIYALSPEAVKLVPMDRAYPITDLFERCLTEKLPVGAHVLDADWIDVGQHETLQRARGQLP
jgi:dTDP-glucose pyrophosphorylase/CBS domain-containing protein